ncbi:MAG TPA: ABC-2 family transporter protein [Herpetosiphonaceae bacterium]
MRRIAAFGRFVWGYVAANFQGALEYRLSFASQVFAMLLNDIMWLVFWIAYFGKFQLVAGWGRDDIVMLWAVVAAGFGLGTTLCGNVFRLAGMIMRGELDFYLALPKPVLSHALISRMSLTAPGDIAFGLIAFGLIVRPSAVQWLLFLVFMLTTALILVSFGVITQSLAFWLGNAEGLAQQLTNAMISFSTYPTVIFNSAVKWALFTVIPAGFIAYVPVQLLREFSWPLFGGLLAFAVGAVALAGAVFRAGLRRYESGNLVLMRE